jgi:hypothetical protein
MEENVASIFRAEEQEASLPSLLGLSKTVTRSSETSFNRLHSFTSQRTELFIITDVRT